jgi:putative NADH-flavin reductase
LLIFGAKGNTVGLIVGQALDRGHDVIAFVLSPDKLATRPCLAIVAGDILDADSLAPAFANSVDAVILALRICHVRPSTGLSEGRRNIVALIQGHAVDRVIAITSLGTGDSVGQGHFVARMIQKTSLRQILAEKGRQERILAASGLRWTAIRPPRLSDKAHVAAGLGTWQRPAPAANRLT